MAKIIVLGGGVVGLGTAMLLAGDGHEVTVLERDAAPPAPSAEGAWTDWERKGVNQFRLPHFFLARYRSIIDSELPQVAAQLEDAGALRQNPLLEAPESVRGPARPNDEEVEVVTGRRPIVEFAVSAAAAATPSLTVRRGVTVASVLLGESVLADVPHVVGVRTEGGEALHADLVVDVTGRRSALPRWLEEAGGNAPREELEESGFMYYGRHFRSADGSLPFAFGGGIQHLGSVSMLTLPADNGTWGVVVVTSAKDKELLGLRDLGRWEAVVQAMPLHAHWLDGEPIEDRVVTMSKIEDRIRYFERDGRPVVTGVVPVGDSWACSNPSLGRGASLGMLHGLLLRDVLRGTGTADAGAVSTSFLDATRAEIEPWFLWTRATDRHRIEQVNAEIAGATYEPDDPGFEFEQSLASAAGKDPDLLRLSIRGAMLLERPEDAARSLGLADRVAELGGGWRTDSVQAPSRDELVRLATR